MAFLHECMKVTTDTEEQFFRLGRAVAVFSEAETVIGDVLVSGNSKELEKVRV